MKRAYWLPAILLALTQSACNTVEGIGEDVEAAGDAVEDATDGADDDRDD